MSPTDVRLWIDPSCPWAWQALTWLHDVRDRGVISLRYSLFSLEVNALALERNDTDPGVPWAEATPGWGHALLALALARREGAQDAFERLLVAIGTRRHEDGQPVSRQMLEAASEDAAMPGLLDRVGATADLAVEVLAEYAEARGLDVFGVPTLQLDDAAVIYGPILAVGPVGEDGLNLWRQVEGLAVRDGFFELKRWPRHLRPGGRPVGP
jgi:predicted DsbA family dithiol-disulfide isomerase